MWVYVVRRHQEAHVQSTNTDCFPRKVMTEQYLLICCSKPYLEYYLVRKKAGAVTELVETIA